MKSLIKLFSVLCCAAVLSSCLNPIGFNPEDLPIVNVSGEIAVTDINSAELNFRNHTRSIDVTRIDIVQTKASKTSSVQYDGESWSLSGSEYVSTTTDARISGSPTSGTQDSILVRPTGQNINNTIRVKRYQIVIDYKKSKSFPTELTGSVTDLEGQIIVEFSEEPPLEQLLRGRAVIHIYRDDTGQIRAGDVVEDPHPSDYLEDLPPPSVDLSGLVIEFGSSLTIEFSPEVMVAVNEAYDQIIKEMKDQGSTLREIASAINVLASGRREKGTVRVWNRSNAEVINLVFKSKLGIGNDIVLGSDYVVQKVSSGGKVIRTDVDEGNYSLFCTLSDGTILLDGRDFYALPDEYVRLDEDNLVIITQADVDAMTPIGTISYSLSSDGGPPALTTDPSYESTEIIITFVEDVPHFIVSGVAYNTLDHDDDDFKTWRLKITPTATKTLSVTIGALNVDPSPHSVTVYKSSPASFVAVEDVVITNGAGFTKDVAKTLQWDVLPATATNKSAYWTIGQGDVNLILSFLSPPPPYGLGSPGFTDHTSDLGEFMVRSKWSYDYFYIAVVVPNGKAPGQRSLGLHSVGQTVIDKQGGSVSVTIQALYHDPERDFVKVFLLTTPDPGPPPAPPPPPQGPSEFNLKIKFIEPASDTLAGIAWVANQRSGVPSDGKTGVLWAASTNSLTYKSYFLDHYQITGLRTFNPKLSSGQEATIQLPVTDGYDLFFIEGDGRVRGYSLSTKTAPPKADNAIFWIPGNAGDVTVQYASKTNQALRVSN
jgi:hypothetical protein